METVVEAVHHHHRAAFEGAVLGVLAKIHERNGRCECWS